MTTLRALVAKAQTLLKTRGQWGGLEQTLRSDIRIAVDDCATNPNENDPVVKRMAVMYLENLVGVGAVRQ